MMAAGFFLVLSSLAVGVILHANRYEDAGEAVSGFGALLGGLIMACGFGVWLWRVMP